MSTPTVMKTIELEALVEDGQLVLSQPLPAELPSRVRLLVLYMEEGDAELNALTDEAFGQRFRLALSASGYETSEQIGQLVHEIKEEQAREWGLP